jgi:putative addiction module component (TIGR02574 family)
MNKPTVDPSQLSVEERLELIDRLWESVARDAPERLDLSPEEEAEIDRRSEELHANPKLAIPWETARPGILEDLERGG